MVDPLQTQTVTPALVHIIMYLSVTECVYRRTIKIVAYYHFFGIYKLLFIIYLSFIVWACIVAIYVM